MYKSHMQLLPGSFAAGFVKIMRSMVIKRVSLTSTHQSSMRTLGLDNSASVFWNSLPLEITSLPNLHQFKSRLKGHLMKILNT